MLALFITCLILLLYIPANKVHAATYLNQANTTITVGEKESLKISGVSSSKAKWSTSNKKIVTVSKSGVIKGIKKGNATITAKYKGVKYTCKVKVVAKSSKKEAAKNIAAKVYKSGQSGTRFIKFTNHNSFAIHASVTIRYYDKKNKYLGSSTIDDLDLPTGYFDFIEVFCPKNYQKIKYKYNIEYIDKGDDAYWGIYKQISFTKKDLGDCIEVKVKNKSSYDLRLVNVTVLYYRKNKLVGASQHSFNNVNAKSSSRIQIDYAYDDAYEDIKFDSYKVYVTDCYY